MLPVKKALCGLLVTLLAGGAGVFDVETISAQEKRGFFEKLFGRNKPAATAKKTPKTQNGRKRATSRNNNKARSANNRPQSGTPGRTKPQLPKSETAKRILVVGDFIAANLADGLEALYKDNPDIITIKQAQASSGLVRDDYYHWPVQIETMIKTHKPDIIIVTLGANDRQSLRLEGTTIEYDSDVWWTHYRARIRNLLSKAGQDEATQPWIWLGLPPFEKTQLNAAALALNSLYKEEVAKARGQFVDIWRGFVDEKGNFNFSGHDVNGQLARLRNGDGINFTAAGRAKLAFYANEAVQAWLNNTQSGAGVFTSSMETENLSFPAEETPAQPRPPTTRITYLPPQKLWDISGNENELVRSAPSPITSPIRPLSYQEGRADYFLITD